MGGLLVINTGGTIGMVPGPDGLQPGVGVVEAALARILPMGGVKVVAFDPLRDSADMGPEDWNRIADLAETADFAGVLVIHGTDTMAMTGAALAAVGVKVPLVLCGSMVPLGMGGDAEGNLALAVEAVQTNVLGTQNVLDSAFEHGVKRMIVLSTDKAVYPINAMGISKAMMEKVMQAKAR